MCVRIIASLAVVAVLGFGTALYHGPGAGWARHSLAGAFYEVFWCLAIFLFRRRPSPAKIAALVFLVTAALEFFQLVRHPALAAIRRNFSGQALIGNHFTWSDFPYYVLGCLAAWLWMRFLARPRAAA